MSFADAELIAEFTIESQEGLANIEQQLLAIDERSSRRGSPCAAACPL